MLSKSVVIKLIKKTEETVKNHPFELDETGSNMENYVEETSEVDIDKLFEYDNDPEAPLMLESRGVMTQDGDKISIIFETHLINNMPAIYTYSFNSKKRDVLTIKKNQPQCPESIDFFTVRGKSQSLAFLTDLLEENATRFTKSLKNYIFYEHGGYIELEFYEELSGEFFEYTKEYLIVEPISQKDTNV